MIDVAFAVPGDIDAATGGYAYARRLLKGLTACGVLAHHIELPGSFPEPAEADLARTRRLLGQIDPATPILFDGLAYGALPPGFLDGLAPKIVALVHHPLAHETGLPLGRQRQLFEYERGVLAQAARVITSSRYTARVLVEEFDVSGSRITVAEPGTAPAERATGTGQPFTMLAVGSLTPRKGYGVLLDALAKLDADNWHLTIVGSPDHDPAEANRIRERVLEAGLRSRVTLAGRVTGEHLAGLYRRADLFVMSSFYEGYGMVLAEAMARGLAIVTTTGGAAAETAPDAAAIKVAPGDADALAAGVATLMRDRETLARVRDASWAAGRLLPQWPHSIAKIADVLKSVHGEERR